MEPLPAPMSQNTPWAGSRNRCRVAARTSSFSFKGQNLEVPEIAERLNVAHVLEGSVTIEMEGAAPFKLGPGDVLQEPPGQSMVGKNLSSTHGAELLVFHIGDKGKPLTVKAE